MQMQKGKYLESQIDRILSVAVSLGYHGHKNHPQRLFDGQYISGEPYDYDLFLPGYYAAFDAKECGGESWAIRDKDIRQAENLLGCEHAGMDAFFLILFDARTKKPKLRRVPVKTVIGILQAGKKTVHVTDGEEWRIDKLLRSLAGN